jgi:hypothetical protein
LALKAQLVELDDSQRLDWRGRHDEKPPHEITQSEIAYLLRRFNIKARSIWSANRRPGDRSSREHWIWDFQTHLAKNLARRCWWNPLLSFRLPPRNATYLQVIRRLIGVYLRTIRRHVFTTERYAAQECPFACEELRDIAVPDLFFEVGVGGCQALSNKSWPIAPLKRTRLSEREL